MNAIYVPFAAKIRRYKHLAKQVDRMLKDGTFRQLATAEQQKLLRKLRQRLNSIGHLFTKNRLKHALAGISMLLGTAIASPLAAQNFAPKVEQPFGLETGLTSGYPTMTDIDGDGDLDYFSVSYDYSLNKTTLKFVENEGTPQSPSFSVDGYQVDPFGVALPGYVTTAVFADLDGDGDEDLLLGAYYGNGFFYMENTGSPTAPAFSAAQHNPFGLNTNGQVILPTVADLDGDGDQDVLAIKEYGEILFYENIGTAQVPAFAAPVTNPFGLNPPDFILGFPALADLDGDGDQDLLFSTYYPGSDIRFAENTGTPEAPSFDPVQTSPFGLNVDGMLIAVPVVADIDNDSDLDVLISDYYNSLLYFFENTQIVAQVPPTASNSFVDLNEDEPYFFIADDFNFMDANGGDELKAVRIVGLPSKGILRSSGQPVINLQEIDAAVIEDLTFDAGPDENGAPYTTFGFQVSDGTYWSTAVYEMTIYVNAVNDAPSSLDAEINLLANETHTFSAGDFPYEDVEGDDFKKVKINSLVDKGSFRFNGADVVVNQEIPVNSLHQLTYVPLPNEEGVPYTSFEFQVSDGSLYSAEVFPMVINITGPNASHDRQLQAEVELSPNPAADVVQVNIEAAKPLGNVQLMVFDEKGRKVLSTGFGNQSYQFRQVLDVRDLAAGVYWLKVASGDKFRTVKFVKL